MENITYEDFIKKLENYSHEDIEIIKKAYEFAKVLHGGQVRQSGEPYIIHPLNVAYILADMHADKDTICAGLLHDTLEDTHITKEDIVENFNQDIADLVDGVTKLAKMNFSSKTEQYYANTRKIITSITKDVRIIIIKLADRLHNMRTIEFKSEFKRKENSLETMEIFVPLAYSIGAYRIKSELEDISFRELKPDKYKQIEEVKNRLEEQNNKILKEMLSKIQCLLNSKNIPNEIKVRTKNIYGIYKRLSEGNKLSDIHDLLSLKVMVDEVFNCYLTLGLVHTLYKPINSKFKDYICKPKTNMYQSLHTTVFGPEERLVQTQIRTFNMDKVASFGLTTYWDIKKDDSRNIMQEKLKTNFPFFKSLNEINEMFNDNEEFVRKVKNDLFSNQVYVRDAEGNVYALPQGSTPIDLAYEISDSIGNTMISALANDKPVDKSYILKSNDIIKFITDPLSFGNRESFLDVAYTSKAKMKIKEFKKEDI